MNDAKTVLIVDDNDVDRELIRRMLSGRFAILEAPTAREGLAALEERQIDCVVLDYRLPDEDGIDVLASITARDTPVIMLTGEGNTTVAVEAMKRGAQDYLGKNYLQRDTLARAVDNALEKLRLEREVRQRDEELRRYVAALDRQRTELASSNRVLAEREAQLRVILGQLPAMIWTTDDERRYTSVSGAVLTAIGVDPTSLVGRFVGDVHPDAIPMTPAEAHTSALEGESQRYEVRWMERTFECHVEPLLSQTTEVMGVVGVALDTTDRVRLEEQLRHAQKMEAVGKLAGGVAHDFNNILTVIVSFAELVRRSIDGAHAAQDDLNEVVRAAERGEALVRQLLTFSRRQRFEPRAVDANALVADMYPMLSRLVGSEVQLDVRPSVGPAIVRVDPGNFEQVLANLAVNAKDAMPNGGALRVTVQAIGGGDGAPGDKGLTPPLVRVSVADTGHGMSRDVMSRVFEPFFTTKDFGRGTGLGLSTSWGIVTQAGGTIWIESDLGKGTTFHVELPATVEPKAAPATAAAESPRAAASSPGGHEAVLVYEHDDLVRRVCVRSLTRLGYGAHDAADADAALAIARTARPAVAIIGFSAHQAGPDDVAAQLRAACPGVRLVLASDDGGAAAKRAAELGRAVTLTKPFSHDDLARRVRELLDG
ncbi:MAG: response regulator [Myxococcales bacterium]|nr:response regulator [Myxococcales bacterium]